MATEYTWNVQPVVVAQLTGEIGTVERQYKFGLCRIRVLFDRMEASQDGRPVPLNHVPRGLQTSANSMRASVSR